MKNGKIMSEAISKRNAAMVSEGASPCAKRTQMEEVEAARIPRLKIPKVVSLVGDPCGLEGVIFGRSWSDIARLTNGDTEVYNASGSAI